MDPSYLPALGACLRNLGEFAARGEVNDETLAEVAAELDRARAAVAGARGQKRANRCLRHPGGPVDPTAMNGCLLCGRRPELPRTVEDAPLGDVVRFAEEQGHEAAAERYGGRALTRALALQAHTPNLRPGPPAPDDQHDDESENP